MADIGLWILFPSPAPGGALSFTSHLYRALEMAGHAPRIYKLGKTTEKKQRPLFELGLHYQNMSLLDACRIIPQQPSLATINCALKNMIGGAEAFGALASSGMRMVVHDTKEAQHLPEELSNPILIRPTLLGAYPGAVLLPHPYVRRFDLTGLDRSGHAAAMCRITSNKRPEMILDANRQLPPHQQVTLGGKPFGPYIHYAIEKKHPEWNVNARSTPMTFHGAAEQLANFRIAVDLTKIPGDGGGTQYTFLEAWDAGCVLVVHKDWIQPDGEMVPGFNCLTIDSSESLAGLLQDLSDAERLRKVRNRLLPGYRESLAAHDPVTVGAAFAEELLRNHS